MMPPFSTVRRAYITVCVSLALSAVGFWGVIMAYNVAVQKSPVPLRQNLRTLPMNLGGWICTSTDVDLSAEIEETLGTDQYIERPYSPPASLGGAPLNLHLAYYTGQIDPMPHVPERCLVAGGWSASSMTQLLAIPVDTSDWLHDGTRSVSGDEYGFTYTLHPITKAREEGKVYLPLGDFKMTVTEFQRSEDPNIRLIAGYFFIANGRMSANAMGVQPLAFNMSEKYAYYCKVQLSAVYHTTDANRWTEYSQSCARFVEALLPQLMRRLPSWPEWEMRDRKDRPATH